MARKQAISVLTLRRASESGPTPHRTVERRYREKLNWQIHALHKRLLATYVDDGRERYSKSFAKRPAKAVIIGMAVEYINQLEHERDSNMATLNKLRSDHEDLRLSRPCNYCKISLNGARRKQGRAPKANR